ncbi:MAG: GNAT family N-acetyltransferase, partial [Myxococcota bacterium]
SELVGVATATPYRGRGLGGWVTVEAARASGAELAVIVAETDAAERLYARLGFERVATIVHAGQRKLRNT